MTDLPPLNALRAFDAAGRCLNFRAAAEELGVTQGAVAQHVRQLEAHLGVTLFDRVPKGLVFTSAGRGYHARIAEAFADLRSATAALRPQPDKVVISVTPTFAAKWLIPNLPSFTAGHPDIDLRIMATEKVSSFHSDGIDLAVRQGTPPFGASLHAIRLFNQDVVAVAAPTLADDRPGPLDPDKLARLPKIHDTHDHWPKYLADLSVQDRSQRGLRLSQTALAVDAALAGQGVALVSRFLVSNEIETGRLIQVGGTWRGGESDFYLIVRRSVRHRSAVAEVMDWLVSHAEEGT